MKHKDVIIIGGGPAGITFGNLFKKLRPEANVAMFRPENHSMVYCVIPYAIEGLFDPSRTFKSDKLVTDAGIELLRSYVTEVDFKSKEVIDSTGDRYSYHKLFIATGASPVRLPLPGIDAPNVFTVKTEDDMSGIITSIKNGARRAVVIGAGAIGIEQAQAYSARGIETWLIDIAPYILPNMLDKEIVTPLNEALEQKGIHCLMERRVEGLEKTLSNISAVHLSDGYKIELDPEIDFVCFSVGMKPDIDIFVKAGIEANGDGIVVDSKMKTNIPDVYAAGDCCTFISAIDGKPVSGKLATNAVPMAKVAARVAAGKDDEYEGFCNGAATCAGNWRVGSTGFTATFAEKRGIKTVSGYGETTTIFPMMPGSEMLKVKIVAEEKELKVIGGQVISKLSTTDKIDIITLSIQQHMTVKELSKLSYSAQPWQSFMPARNAIVEACEYIMNLPIRTYTKK